MNVLVLAPHPDDESIGCGGTICLHMERNDRVSVAFLTSGELGLKHLTPEDACRVREKEAEAAASVLGLVQLHFLRFPDWFLIESVDAAADALGSILAREQPDLIYVPHDGEWHPDHKASLPCLSAALRTAHTYVPTLLTYEVWTPLPEYDQVEDITPHVNTKLRAIRCYRSQLKAFRYDRAARGLGQYRGALAAHCRYAEVFRYVDLQQAVPSGEETK